MERWDWGEIVIDGPWLEAPEVYRNYVDKMHLPWISMQFNKYPYFTSEMTVHHISERMTSSKIWGYLYERLNLFGFKNNLAGINLYSVVRAKGIYKSLKLFNVNLKGQIDYILVIRITDKPKFPKILRPIFNKNNTIKVQD